jgi:Ca2+:H+ antiporter
MKLRQILALLLLFFLPLSALADRLHWGDGAVFVLAVLAILPLAVWLSIATEELSLALGPTSAPCSMPCSATPPS